MSENKPLLKLALPVLVLVLVVSACIEQDESGADKPQLEIISPQGCDTIYFGYEFAIQIKIVDNSGLGNISLDVYNNFGHHNHGAHETCAFDPPKDPVNPYFGNWMYELPDDETEMVYTVNIKVPVNDSENNPFDIGDYHFHIYVTDADANQSFTSFDVKFHYK